MSDEHDLPPDPLHEKFGLFQERALPLLEVWDILEDCDSDEAKRIVTGLGREDLEGLVLIRLWLRAKGFGPGVAGLEASGDFGHE